MFCPKPTASKGWMWDLGSRLRSSFQLLFAHGYPANWWQNQKTRRIPAVKKLPSLGEQVLGALASRGEPAVRVYSWRVLTYCLPLLYSVTNHLKRPPQPRLCVLLRVRPSLLRCTRRGALPLPVSPDFQGRWSCSVSFKYKAAKFRSSYRGKLSLRGRCVSGAWSVRQYFIRGLTLTDGLSTLQGPY